MGGNPFQRVFGGLAEARNQILAAFGQDANAKFRTGFQDLTYGASASQPKGYSGRIKGALLHPTGKHGQVLACLVRRNDEKPAGNAAQSPGNPIEIMNLFDALLVHTGILQIRLRRKRREMGKMPTSCP